MRNYLSIIFVLIALQVGASVSKTVTVSNAGTIAGLLTPAEKSTITQLTVTGDIDARDFKVLRDNLTVLEALDLSDANIKYYYGNEGTYPSSWFGGFATYQANEIPQYAFIKDAATGKKSLKSVILPTSSIAIGDYAFQDCTNLVDVTFPTNLITIGKNAFYFCTNLGDFIVPNKVTTIGNSAFQECHALTNITLGEKVNSIGNQSFYECHNLKVINCLNVTPPVMQGSPFAFTYISMVFVPTTSIPFYKLAGGWSAFNIGGSTLIEVNNPTSGSLLTAITTQTQVPLSLITKLKVTGELNNKDIYLIRDSLKILMEIDLSEAEITNNTLPANAFKSKGILTEVHLPASIIEIGDNAFNSCGNLAGRIPLTDSLVRIGNEAFFNCKLVTGDLVLPVNMQTIGNKAFEGCKSLAGAIVLPPTLLSIGNSAFAGCIGLTGSLTIPDSVVTLGSYAFQNCNGLTGNLKIHGALQQISYGTFASCTGLSGSLTIPSSVTIIEGSAFSGCKNFTELILPKNITTIGDEAFYGWTGLTKIVVLKSTPPTIYANTFGSLNKSNCTLAVPHGSKPAYQAANYWKTFPNIIERSATEQLTIHVGMGGKVKQNSLILPNDTVVSVISGATTTLIFIPDAGYELHSLMYGGVDVSSQVVNNQYTTSDINFSTTIEVTFKKHFELAISIGANGSVKVDNLMIENDTVIATYEGEKKTFTFIPALGYDYDVVMYGGIDIVSFIVNDQFITPIIQGNDSLVVTFKQTTQTFDIAIEIGENGSVVADQIVFENDTVLKVLKNATKTFTFIPTQGYEIDSLSFDGADVKSQLINNQYTTQAIYADATLYVTFKNIKYNVSIRDGAKGAINLLCNYGDKPMFSFEPFAGWEINTIIYNGTDITNSIQNGILILGPVSSNNLLLVSFVEKTSNTSQAAASNVKVYADSNSGIIIEGLDAGENLTVYTINGKQVHTEINTSSKTLIPLPDNAVYIVKTRTNTYKVML